MENKINLLLVEDNPADAELTCEKLKSSKILHNLTVVEDGEEAMNYLKNMPPYQNAEKPDLILLDLNLPKKNGIEVLKDIKGDDKLKYIPVIILTSSQADEDILKSYELQASAYVTKPVDLAGFGKIVRAIDSFWFSVVKFPNIE